MTSGWVGVDLDGTLAKYGGWSGPTTIGAPIKPMVEKVKQMLKQGITVKIFTARVWTDGSPLRNIEVELSRKAIEKWCEEHIGQKLEITNVKDFAMIELYDDRAWRVETNTGKVIG